MGKKPLKIAILAQYLPPIYSGAGRQALKIGMELHNKGHSVFFVTCRYPTLKPRPVINGIKTYEVTTRNISSIQGHFTFGIKALIILLKKRHDFDILFSPGMCPLIAFVFIILKALNKKIVLRMSLFTDNPEILKRRKIGRYLLLPYHLADSIVAPSTARLKDASQAFPEYAEKIVRINNCVNTKVFNYCSDNEEKLLLKKKLNLDPGLQYVSYVGRIIKRKGIEFLIEAWKEVVKDYDKAVLLLIGPNDYASKGKINSDNSFYRKINKEIENSNIGNKVIFIGETNKVPEYLKVSDVFVFASIAEGLPSAPIEAMAAGVPPVVLDIKDIMTDIIDTGQNGLIISQGDIDCFREELIRVLKDDIYRLELSRRAREKAVKHFSVECVGQKYIELFQFILSKP